MAATPTDLSTPELRRFHDYWQSKRRDGKLPGRQDIDPVEIPELLPHLTLFDVVGAGAVMRFRFRLVGTANVELIGQECTGRYIDEMFTADEIPHIHEVYSTVVAERKPHFWRTTLMVQGREHVNYARLLLPLASDGETVDMLIAALVEIE